MGLLLEFGGRFAGALGDGKHVRAEAIGPSFGGVVVGDHADGGRCLGGGRSGAGLIVEPVARGEQYEDQDGDDHRVVGPAAALIRPEQGA